MYIRNWARHNAGSIFFSYYLSSEKDVFYSSAKGAESMITMTNAMTKTMAISTANFLPLRQGVTEYRVQSTEQRLNAHRASRLSP